MTSAPVVRAPDAGRAAALRRMKVLAAALLALAAVVYALTTGEGGALAYVNAAAEAAMVGALADWFAVTALFRRPLGLPIPHTALIPNRKDELGRSLQEFVAGNFLTEPVVRDAVRRAGLSRRVGHWLSDPAHAARVTAELATVARGALRVLRDDDVTAVLEQIAVKQLSARSWSPTSGHLLARVVEDGAHHRLVDRGVDQLHGWLLDHEELVRSVVLEQAPVWTPLWVDEKVAHRVYVAAVRFLSEVQADQRHRVRQALDELLGRLARDLEHDQATRDRFDAVIHGLLARREVREAAAAVWTTLRGVLEEAVDDPGSELRQRATAVLGDAGRRLAADEGVAARVDLYVEDAVAYVVSTYSGELATVISDTVDRWDGREASRLIELHVGRDLQFIRINGTVVGGLAGLAIHAVTVLLS